MKMSIVRKMDDLVEEIMDNFEFEKVHEVMDALKWEWVDGNGHFRVPSEKELRRRASEMLYQTINSYLTGIMGGEDINDPARISSGGFECTFDGESLNLNFVLADWTAYNE